MDIFMKLNNRLHLLAAEKNVISIGDEKTRLDATNFPAA